MGDAERRIVVLYGAPTAGKDTITEVLVGRGLGFEHFVKHKVGSGSRHGYTVVSANELDALRDAGRIVSEVRRYGSIYAVDSERLADCLERGVVPVIHSAEPAEITKLTEMGAMLVVMECSRTTARERLSLRDLRTVDERLEVWDHVTAQIPAVLPLADIRIATDTMSPDAAADAIVAAVFAASGE